MKTNMRLSLIQTCLLAAVLLALPVEVQAQDFTYETNNGAITITSYIGTNNVVTIPDIINGLPVTSIGSGAFYGAALTSVTISDSVTSIGDSAFRDCYNLTTVYFTGNAPAADLTVFGLERSWPHVFHYDATAYFLPGTTGWSNTFAGLPTVMLNGPAQIGTTAEGWNYVSDQVRAIITGYAGSNQVAAIPSPINGVPVIGIAPYAFQDNNSLTSVTIPDSVTNIGDYAFAGCAFLRSATIGNSVTSIGDWAFINCFNLTNVTIGNGVAYIGEEAFGDCESLTSVTIPNSVTSMGYEAFAGCGLTNVTIGNGVTSMGDYAFEECTLLTSVTIGNGVTTIGDGAFEECINLTSVTIPNSVTNIGGGAFYDCTSLTSVFFMGNAPTTDSAAFYDPATVYYLPGTLGWDKFYATTGLATAFWFLPNPLILNQGPGFGIQSNQFGFTISWATNVSVVVEACSNLSNPGWLPVSTNTLTGGTSYFSDPQSANLPARFYRLRSP